MRRRPGRRPACGRDRLGPDDARVERDRRAAGDPGGPRPRRHPRRLLQRGGRGPGRGPPARCNALAHQGRDDVGRPAAADRGRLQGPYIPPNELTWGDHLIKPVSVATLDVAWRAAFLGPLAPTPLAVRQQVQGVPETGPRGDTTPEAGRQPAGGGSTKWRPYPTDGSRPLRRAADDTALESLRQSERDLADFLESGPVALHWVGPDGVILRGNQAELAGGIRADTPFRLNPGGLGDVGCLARTRGRWGRFVVEPPRRFV